MDRETQSRLIEFLLTYGWAVLVLFFALGALIFFGLFPRGMSYCDIDPRIECIKWSITSDGNITLILRNKFGKDLTNVGIRIGNCSKSFDIWKAGTILGGNFTKLTECSEGIGYYKEPINITYKLDQYTATGELTGIISQ